MGNNDYGLIRYFAKSTFWGREPIIAVNELVEKGFLAIQENRNGVNYYDVTKQGTDFLNQYQLPEYLDAFTQEIDASGFIKMITYKLAGKDVDNNKK
ncbi:MAG: hypothetical protein SFU87_07525 [Chitinophagaceae bacterium]|nr:hypothetical protein [Chitinophagaceae bacterium]